jgi:hypothetical protein
MNFSGFLERNLKGGGFYKGVKDNVSGTILVTIKLSLFFLKRVHYILSFHAFALKV